MRISDWSSDVCSSDLVAGFGQARVAHVRLDVEMLVLDPIGMIDVEGQPVEAAPEQGRGVDAAFDVRDDVLEAHEAAGRSRWIIDINPHNMRKIVRGLRSAERRGGIDCVSKCRSRW